MNGCGTAASYHRGCHCTRCREAWRVRQLEYRRQRAARRVLDADGRLKAPLPPERHGSVSTYYGWTCRCRACSIANTNYARMHRATRVTDADYEFCDVHGEVNADHECEAG